MVVVNKSIKTITEMVKTIDQKLDAKSVEPKNSNEEEEKIEKIFEKKGIGRPVGDYDAKRKSIVIC